jgi:hypothetical protein
MDAEALVRRYEEVDQAREEQLLLELLRGGWEAGCWIRPDPELLISATQEDVQRLLDRLQGRSSFRRAEIDDPFPSGRECDPIVGESPCLVLLTQRCDVVGMFKNEPLIELAHATYCTDRSRLDNAWKNSPREFPVDPRAGATHLVDLRYRYFVSKLDLLDLEPKQALPRDTADWPVRVRFGLRAAQRYTRSAVPDRLVNAVVGPLYKLIKGDKDVTVLFSEWTIFHGDQHDRKPGLRAVYPVHLDPTLSDDEQDEQERQIQTAAEDKFQEIIEALPAGAMAELDLDDDRRTRAIDERELTVADWRLSWKLEWDHESFSGQSGAALPAR